MLRRGDVVADGGCRTDAVSRSRRRGLFSRRHSWAAIQVGDDVLGHGAHEARNGGQGVGLRSLACRASVASRKHRTANMESPWMNRNLGGGNVKGLFNHSGITKFKDLYRCSYIPTSSLYVLCIFG